MANSVYGKGPVKFKNIQNVGTAIGFGSNPQPQLTYYVKKEGGSDTNQGFSWDDALKTYQGGVTRATRAANRYKDVDLIIAPAEYDEQVIVSGVAQGVYQGSTWYGYRIGRLRIMHMGKAVILKNSGDDSSDTLLIRRPKVEIYGGTFRNYTNSGDFSAVHWERITDLGDVIQGAMYGSKVEGRTSAQIGIDIDAAQYVEIHDTWVSGFDTGILVAGNSYGGCVENIVEGCRFRGNTNDVEVGASSFTLLENNIHMDVDTTKFVTDSSYSGRGGTIADLIVAGGYCAAGDLNKFDATNIDVMAIGITQAVTPGATTAFASKGA